MSKASRTVGDTAREDKSRGGASKAVDVASDKGTEKVWVDASFEALDALDADTLVLHLTSDLRPLMGVASFVDWRLCGRLSQLVLRGVITGQRGERVLVPTQGRIRPIRIFVFGWGSHASMQDGAEERFLTSVDVIVKAKADRVAVALPEPAGKIFSLVDEHVVRAFGSRLSCVFAPDPVYGERKDTRPIPAP